MSKITTPVLFLLIAMSLSSCQAIGNIFSAGVWVGLTIALIVIIILVVVFRRKS
ncbi:MAG TPA: phosphatidate cytidylyltransferase [Parafilimonas sp.]